MNNHAKVIEYYGMRLLVGKECRISRQGHGPGDPTGGIVIAGNNEDPDPGLCQLAHPAGKKKPCVVVLPVTVIEIAGYQNKGDLILNGQVDQIIKGSPRCPPDLLDRRIFMDLQASQGAVEVDVCCVDETKHMILYSLIGLVIPVSLATRGITRRRNGHNQTQLNDLSSFSYNQQDCRLKLFISGN